MKMKKNKNVSPLACTGKFCRHEPGPGQGVQFTFKDGKPQRYCPDCWNDKCEAEVAAATAQMQPQPPASAANPTSIGEEAGK